MRYLFGEADFDTPDDDDDTCICAECGEPVDDCECDSGYDDEGDDEDEDEEDD